MGNEAINLYLDGGYNGIYNYLVGGGIFWYADLCVVDDELSDFYYDYLTLASLLSVTTDEQERASLQTALLEGYQLRKQNLSDAKEKLSPFLHGQEDPSLRFTAIGHSHLDLAWLWPIRETKRKAARTFANQLNNVKRTPEYVYGASQAQQFDYIKHKYPAQYARLQQMAKNGNLELQGGMWVEADTNLSAGEALIRQIHYGKKFFFEEFGQTMRICWLPDVFGYNGNLPQILSKMGLPYFMTIKLSWNEHNRFPYRSFNWDGIDGSRVLVHMAPDDTYNSAGSPACAKHAKANYPEIDLAPEALMIYGIGDGGGGPGEAHIELVKRQQHLQNSPAMHFGKAIDFFDRLSQWKEKLPVYQGELYLEKHQGTYTTQGRNKRFNRQSEYALQTFESLAALAYLRGAKYPHEKLDRWWKEVLLYQFHDIIPGSSITRVYEESRKRYEIILSEIREETEKIFQTLGAERKISFYNPTGFHREEDVRYQDQWFHVCIEPFGFAPGIPGSTSAATGSDNCLENPYLRVIFNKFGEIISLFDKTENFEYAKEPLNQLILYQDKRLFYNAWDIDWQYFRRPSVRLKRIKSEIFRDGSSVVCRNHFRHGKTEINQDVVLHSSGKKVEFITHVDYHERHRMLRADFVPAVFSDRVQCDIQFGSLFRSTKDDTLIEKAQFEICAHKYIDVSDELHGISLLNDCKYGHRVKEGRISLNLLRSPVFPDPVADRGEHVFTYALYPHNGAAGIDTLKESVSLNRPLIPCDQWIDMKSMAFSTNSAVVLETIKKADQEDAIVLRLYESQGQNNNTSIQLGFTAAQVVETDLDEHNEKPCSLSELRFTPYEIKTVLCRMERGK